MNVLLKKYLSHNLSIIGTRPSNGKMPFISNLIIEILKDKNKKIILFSLNAPDTWYLKYLLNNITNIDIETISNYLSPCKSTSKNNHNHIERNKFIDGIEYLQQKNLIIYDYNLINPELNTINSIIKDNDYNQAIIIIDKLDNLIEKNIPLENVLNNLSQLIKKLNINIIAFTNLSKEFEFSKKEDLTSFNNYKILAKYSNLISIINNKDHIIVKEKI